MYTLSTPLSVVKGVGPKLAEVLGARQLLTVKDLLLFVPLRYEDRSQRLSIRQLMDGENADLVTLQARVHTTNNYYKGRRSIQSATISDDTGKLKLMWFNNRFIIDKLKVGQEYLFSGKLNDRRMMVQAVVEDVKDDTIHTGRLVPVYSTIPNFKQGSLRRILKHILDNLSAVEDELMKLASSFVPLTECVTQLHFPDEPELVIKARERLALEELLSLMQKSHQIKDEWGKNKNAAVIETSKAELSPTKVRALLPASLPFELTSAQLRSLTEILSDLTHSTPMNRLLIGDVGSGKTVVAGVACQQVLAAGHSAVLVAPTRILAEQHAETLAKLFPDLPLQLVTAMSGKAKSKILITGQPQLYIGTHAVLNRLAAIQPALVIYDEQHRFGVSQRSQVAEGLKPYPHVLTMSATPIPRSLMLTIFSHLALSLIDELPKGRLPVKTWVVPEAKRADSYAWIHDQLSDAQALVICPFIDPSNIEALENVAAVKDKFEEIKAAFPQLEVGLLHGKMSKAEQSQVTDKLYQKQIQILVTTPIVEVGVDLPAASIIIIEAAERFGLASLHQLRGRVGRAGQQAYCLLFTTAKKAETRERLQKFSQITNGRELADLDLQHRGAGDIFGTQQHGFDELQFASWANLELISQAREYFEQLSANPNWQPFLEIKSSKKIPLAN